MGIVNKFTAITTLFYLLICCPFFSLGQQHKIDSLKMVAEEFSSENDFYQKDTVYINLLLKIGDTYKFVKLDSMLYYAEKSKTLSDKINYNHGKVASLNILGNFHLFKGDYEKAIEIHTNNLEIAKKIGENAIASRIYNSLGYIHLSTFDYPMAYKTCSEGLDFALQNNQDVLAIQLNGNIGVLFSLLKDYETSLMYFKDCFKYKEINEDPEKKGWAMANMGYSHLYLKNYDKGFYYIQQAIDIFEKLKISKWKAFSYLTMGSLFFEQKKYEEALYYYKLSETEHLKIEDIKGMTDTKIALAKVYLDTKDFVLAEKYAVEAEQSSQQIKYLDGVLKVSDILYRLNREQGDLKKSITYLESYTDLYDSISSDENKKNVQMLEARINFEREKENLKFLKDETILKQKKYVQRATIGLLIAVVIAFLVFRSHRREKALNKNLAEKTKILSESQTNLNLINKNQDKLFSIVGHDLRGPIVSLKELLGLALESPSGEEYFHRFAPKLKKDVDHIHFTLDNLLNWGRTQMTGATIYPEILSVKTEIDAIKELFRENLAQKTIELKNELSEEIKIMMDINHFSIVFRNLISNAIKFTPDNGKISVNAITNNDSIIISVNDNGIGIDGKIIEKIFDSSLHYSTFGTNQERGTGLGLSLCKEMIEKNKGYISVKSKVNEGTSFIIALPKA